MTFEPYYDKIVIKPFKKERIIRGEDADLVEAGEVIAVGEAVKWLKIGDTVFFDSWGSSKTPVVNGEQHYVVSVREDVILGKISKHEESK